MHSHRSGTPSSVQFRVVVWTDKLSAGVFPWKLVAGEKQNEGLVRPRPDPSLRQIDTADNSSDVDHPKQFIPCRYGNRLFFNNKRAGKAIAMRPPCLHHSAQRNRNGRSGLWSGFS